MGMGEGGGLVGWEGKGLTAAVPAYVVEGVELVGDAGDGGRDDGAVCGER